MNSFTISADNASTIVNVIAYEDYARLKRKYMRAGIDRRPSFEEFYDECGKRYELDMLPRAAWECGYHFIADLFDDNERFGTSCDEEARFNRSVVELLRMVNNR